MKAFIIFNRKLNQQSNQQWTYDTRHHFKLEPVFGGTSVSVIDIKPSVVILCYLFKGNPYKYWDPPTKSFENIFTLRIFFQFYFRWYILSIYKHCPLTHPIIYVSTGGYQFLPRCNCISADRDSVAGKWSTSGIYSGKCWPVKILSRESIFVKCNLGWILLNNTYFVLIQIAGNLVPKGPIYDNSAMVCIAKQYPTFVVLCFKYQSNSF